MKTKTPIIVTRDNVVVLPSEAVKRLGESEEHPCKNFREAERLALSFQLRLFKESLEATIWIRRN